MITVNGIDLRPTLFPDNTSQVWKVPEEILRTKVAEVHWDFQHEGEFMQIAQLSDLLSYHNVPHTLYMSYLPYGRQDKGISNDSTFALSTFARHLNNLYFECITILDPHSEEALRQIHWAYPIYPEKRMREVMARTGSAMVAYPDKGAVEKYFNLYPDLIFVRGEKTRDQLTGQITDYEITGNVKGEKVLIVDDICDGGATFVLLAHALYDAGATEVNLFVSHGIFSRGLKPLFDAGIKGVFTAAGEVSEMQNGFTYRRL